LGRQPGGGATAERAPRPRGLLGGGGHGGRAARGRMVSAPGAAARGSTRPLRRAGTAVVTILEGSSRSPVNPIGSGCSQRWSRIQRPFTDHRASIEPALSAVPSVR
jgi:hypothetical protein